MKQWQFKLFEYDIREDPNLLERVEYKPGIDQKKFIVQMYGIDEQGKTACIFVKGFCPFFYVKVHEDWDKSIVTQFQSEIKEKMGEYFENSLLKCKLEKHKKLYLYDNGKQYNFVKLKFSSLGAFNKAKNLWYENTYKNGTSSRKLKEGGYTFMNYKNIELYEAQIPPLLRLFHIQNINPSGWIILRDGCFTENLNKKSTCDYEFIVHDYTRLEPLKDSNKEMAVIPYKILSLDIEASSSHGDFPLARKDYLKLSTNIIDYLIKNNINNCTHDILKDLIKTGFGYKNLKNIEKIYLKNNITEDECDKLINQLLNMKPANEETFININEEEEEEEEEEEPQEFYIEKKQKKEIYKNKENFVLDIINDYSCSRNLRIIELAKCFGQHNPKHDNIWDGIFPEIEGDKVTFIGSTLRRNGEDTPYLKHCIVVNSCNNIEDIVVESYNTEKEALIAWTKLIQKENPDIIIGYNHHGWDQGFMFDRSKILNCQTEFSKLSRMKNEVCIKEIWDYKTKQKRKTIEESSIKIASGQFDLRYFNMSGRLQIDFLNVFRREEQLSSYKLDYVSGYFIGDNINDIQYDEGFTILTSKNITGLNKNDYIMIEEIGHSTDLFQNGKKFKVIEIDRDNGIIILNEIVKPNKNKILRWCLGKDDIGPQDIFKLTNEGPEGRAIVGKYCIKDCDLVHDLMRKNDTLTSFTEMSNLTWVPKSFLVFRGQGIKLTSYVAQKCREKNTLMPVLDKEENNEGYEGAIVLEPKCNLYLKKPVACVDYSSLYPSSIISENISHDSKVWTKEYDLDDNLLKETGEKDENDEYLYDNIEGIEYVNITYDTFKWERKTPKAAATKIKCGYKICRFVQPKDGDMAIMPSILDELLGARKSTKKQMKNEKDPFMKNVYDKRQLSIKICANSLYGQAGAQTSTFYDKDVAASTTATGRKLLIYAKSIVEVCFDNVTMDTKNYGKVKVKGEYIYGDTDSVFFTLNLCDLDGNEIIGHKALEITIELAPKVGELATMMLKNPHDLEYEKTFLPFCLLSKKRYVGILYEDNPNKGKRKSMGIVLKRRDNAGIVKDIYGGVIDILMKDKSIPKAVDFVKNSLQEVIDKKYPQQKFIITKSLRSFYKNPMQIAHNVLAQRIGDRDPGNKPKPGDRIPFVYIKNSDKKALQGDKIELPTFVNANNIPMDYGFYITNQIMKPVQQVFALVLEQMNDFIIKRGKTMRTWHSDVEKLHEKWKDPEKFNKKYEELRCKEVKNILFDPFIKLVK